jgi:hypothetical protein
MPYRGSFCPTDAASSDDLGFICTYVYYTVSTNFGRNHFLTLYTRNTFNVQYFTYLLDNTCTQTKKRATCFFNLLTILIYFTYTSANEWKKRKETERNNPNFICRDLVIYYALLCTSNNTNICTSILYNIQYVHSMYT